MLIFHATQMIEKLSSNSIIIQRDHAISFKNIVNRIGRCQNLIGSGTEIFIQKRKGNNKRMFKIKYKRTLCHIWRIYQRIRGTAEKKGSWTCEIDKNGRF